MERGRDAPGAIFCLCRRSLAGAAVDLQCLSAGVTGDGERQCRLAGDTHPFRAQMAGAHRFRHQDPPGSTDADGEDRSGCPGVAAEMSTKVRVRDAFAQLPFDPKLAASSDPKKPQPKLPPKRKVAKRHVAPPTMLVAQQPQQPQFGFFRQQQLVEPVHSVSWAHVVSRADVVGRADVVSLAPPPIRRPLTD